MCREPGDQPSCSALPGTRRRCSCFKLPHPRPSYRQAAPPPPQTLQEARPGAQAPGILRCRLSLKTNARNKAGAAVTFSFSVLKLVLLAFSEPCPLALYLKGGFPGGFGKFWVNRSKDSFTLLTCNVTIQERRECTSSPNFNRFVCEEFDMETFPRRHLRKYASPPGLRQTV